MNSSTYRFILDLHSTQSQISLPVTLGDTARVFEISFSDGGQPYIIETGVLAKIEIKRPTGTFIEAFCPIEKNTTVKYKFSQNKNTAAVLGVHDCSVTLYDAEGEKIGSPRFSMVVSDRVVNSDDINLTDEDKTAIDAMIEVEASRQAAETGRVNAEALRVTAEEGRVEAETARKSASEEAVKNANDAATKANKIADLLQEKLDNGELNGSDGADGEDGEDGKDFDTSNYYTMKEVDDKIASAITTTLNEEV